MRLLNIWQVQYSEPTNYGDEADNRYYSKHKEALKEFNRQLEELKRDLKNAEDDVSLGLYRNGVFKKGCRVFDGKLEKI